MQMPSTNNFRFVALVAVCLGGFFATTNARAVVVLYEDDFSGGAVPIHGVAPDTNNYDGVSTWTAGNAFTADGNVLGLVDDADEGSLMVPFEPVNGQVYTMTASFTNNSPAWLAVGFAQLGAANDGTSNGVNARHPNQLGGRLWGLSRNRPGMNLQEFFEGGGTANNNATASGAIVAGLAVPIEIEIVLDTRNYAAWQYNVLYNGVSPLGAPVVAVNTADLRNNINFVGLSNEVNDVTDPPNVNKLLASFRLEAMCDPGDVDCSGSVTMADFNPIRDNAFEAVTSRGAGDLNGDGLVDFLDFREWKDNAGEQGVGVSFLGSSVPEPTSAVLTLIAGCALVAARRRRPAASRVA
jgi:hypothetical protein